jgi:hypothetical protein
MSDDSMWKRHTVALYEAIPLFLIVEKWWEGAALSALTLVTWLLTDYRSERTVEALALWRAQAQLWFLYLPCLVMVLRRPNVAPPDDRLGHLLNWTRVLARGRIHAGESHGGPRSATT